ncbi:Ribosomal large subunit pseudouridine synthase D [bacterium HR36]|nr:Ribosomal large subunit pseudouridine synthase D [bacterium HR36]
MAPIQEVQGREQGALAPRDSRRVLELTLRHRPEVRRLDQFLAGALPGFSRSAIQRAIEQGQVTVNGQAVKASYKLREGDHIRAVLPEPPRTDAIPENIPLDILYEDEYLAAINKPPGLVVHPAPGHRCGTLVNALLYHFGRLSQVQQGQWTSADRADSPFRPGIVHRLDRDTSGVILIAKQDQAHRHLSAQFQQRQVYKEYLALVHGEMDRDRDYIEAAIGRHPQDRERMATFDEPDDEEGVKDACTFYEVLERFRGFTYVRCLPRTGRTHQIRVHLAHIGHPIVADEDYSHRGQLRLSQLWPACPPTQDRLLAGRQLLHAHRLRVRHPVTGRELEFTAPIPSDFHDTLAALRQYRSLG